MRHSIPTLAVALLAVALSCSRPKAVPNPRPQLSNTGMLSGVVTDKADVPLSGVAVVASTADGRSLAITDETGAYVIGHLQPGIYDLTFDPCSLDSVSHEVTVQTGRTTHVDARLGETPPPRVASIPTPTIAGETGPAPKNGAALRGVVRDQSTGDPLDDVAVVATSPASSRTRSTITDLFGRYAITELPPGTYAVTFYHAGATVRRTGLTLEPGTVLPLDETLDGTRSEDELATVAPLAPVLGPGATGVTFPAAASLERDYAAEGIDTGAAEHSSAARRQLLQAAGDADELWIIARTPTGTATRASRRRYGSGQLCGFVPSTGENVLLPQRQTKVNAQILAYAATVGVKQSYRNPYQERIEAIYTFPLPQNASVSDFVVTIGKRRIRGIIRERGEAERIYAEARASGYMAALLTQHRPNVFTQKVANIDPGRQIDINLTYYHLLPYRDGAYTFVFPTVVGPRFNPPGTSRGVGAVAKGSEGSSGQPVEVSYLGDKEKANRTLDMTVDIDAGMSIEEIESDSYPIEVEHLSPSRSRVRLARGAALPNRDYVLRYRVAGDRVKSAFLVHEARNTKYFTFVLQPPRDLVRLERAPLEMIFVIDCSGSMRGAPLAKAKRAIRNALTRLESRDTFQLVRFADRASAFGPRPIPATPENMMRALAYLDSLAASGDTQSVAGISAALAFPHAENRLRLVTFLTDGYVGNEEEILSTIYRNLGASRIFSFGIGSSVNRYLLERMAKIGRGAVAYVSLDDDLADAAVDTFYERISHPALSDIRVDFDGMRVSEVYPSRIPDLFVGRPVILTGKLTGPVGDKVEIHGRVRGIPSVRTIPIAREHTRKHPALAKLWARMKIADLTDQAVQARDVAPLTRQIRKIALYHGIVSSFTSFVAVDTTGRGEGKPPRPVDVAVPLPDGVGRDAIDE